jgi:hypothetical protein
MSAILHSGWGMAPSKQIEWHVSNVNIGDCRRNARKVTQVGKEYRAYLEIEGVDARGAVKMIWPGFCFWSTKEKSCWQARCRCEYGVCWARSGVLYLQAVRVRGTSVLSSSAIYFGGALKF